MFKRLINMSTEYLISRHVISAEDREVYEYGFHSLYSNILIFSLIGLFSLLMNQLPQTIVYHIAFITMRTNAGGYHSKTQVRCFFISTIIWLLSLWVINQLHTPVFIVILSFLSAIIVWVKAPIEHENNPMSEIKRSRMKFRSRILSAAFVVLVILICAIMGVEYRWIAASFSIGMISHACLIIFCFIVHEILG